MEFKAVGTFANIDEIITANKRAGKHFFDADTMNHWNACNEPQIYAGHYFIDSIQLEETDEYPRRHKLRVAFADGSITGFGGLLGFSSFEDAVDAVLAVSRCEAKFPIRFIDGPSEYRCQYTSHSTPGLCGNAAFALVGDIATCDDHFVKDCEDYLRINS